MRTFHLNGEITVSITTTVQANNEQEARDSINFRTVKNYLTVHNPDAEIVSFNYDLEEETVSNSTTYTSMKSLYENNETNSATSGYQPLSTLQ